MTVLSLAKSSIRKTTRLQYLFKWTPGISREDDFREKTNYIIEFLKVCPKVSIYQLSQLILKFMSIDKSFTNDTVRQ